MQLRNTIPERNFQNLISKVFPNFRRGPFRVSCIILTLKQQQKTSAFVIFLNFKLEIIATSKI